MKPGDKKVEHKEPEAAAPDPPAPPSPGQLRRIASGHRVLKLLVIGQAVAIMLLFGLVVGTIAYRLALP